jgi:hypothetical protein
MPTPTLDAGTFLIYNIHTSRYLFTVWNAVSGSPAYTSDFVNESSPDVNVCIPNMAQWLDWVCS